MTDLRDWIDDGEVHILDGAMGTLLYERGVFLNVCYDQLSVSQPERVAAVHQDYVEAGAELLRTCTFGANPVKLAGFDLMEKTEEINRASVGLAKDVAGEGVRVLGTMGPLGVPIASHGAISGAQARGHFGRQVQGLMEGGVDGFVLETFSDPEELHSAIDAVRSEADLPIFAQVSDPDGALAADAVEKLAALLEDWGADVIGANCSSGPSRVLDVIEQMARVTNLPLIAQPSAGLQRIVGDRTLDQVSPQHLAGYATRMVSAGARFVGGCCGTTPAHIRAIRAAVRGQSALRREHGLG